MSNPPDPTTDARIEEVKFKAGEILFKEGETSFHFFVIQEGKVEIFKTGADGEKLPLGLMSEGSSIGEFAMLDHSSRSATARAVTEVIAAKVSEEAYLQLITELPDWAIAVMRGMIERLRHTNDIIRRSGIVSETLIKQIEETGFKPGDPDPLDSDDSPFLGTNQD